MTERIRRILAALATFCVAGAVLGCASTPAPILLTLPSAVAATPSPAVVGPGAAAPVLTLSRVDLPEYVVARRVRYRAEGSVLKEWPNTYWAERIEIGVSREFAAAMRERLPAWRVCEVNCGEQPRKASLQLTFGSMDYIRSERRLHADFRLFLWSSDSRPRLLWSAERSIDVTSDGDTAQAQAFVTTEALRQIATLAEAALKAPGHDLGSLQ